MSLASPSPLAEYAGMLWRRKIMILMIALALTAPALILSMLQPPEYQASSALALSSPVATSDQTIKSAELSDTEMTTQAAIMKGDAVSTAAVARGARSAVSTSLTTKSNIMTVTALGPSGEAAAQSANSYADAYIEMRTRQQQSSFDDAIKQLGLRINGLRDELRAVSGPDTTSVGQLAGLESQQSRIELQRSLAASSAVVIVRAVPPADPTSPQILRNTLVGLVLGLALGVAVAILSESSRRRRAGSGPADRPDAPASSSPAGDRTQPAEETTVRAERVPAQATESPRHHAPALHAEPAPVNNHHGGPARLPTVGAGGAGTAPSPRPR